MLVVIGVLAAGAVAFAPDARTRNAGIAGAMAALLIAPATWSVQTLGHATNGTFPAGGPQTAGFGGPGGGGGRGGFGGGPARHLRATQRRPARPGGTAPARRGRPLPARPAPPPARPAPPRAAARPPARPAPPRRGGSTPGAAGRGGFGGPGGGGAFGGNSASLTSALAYIKANGGGTLAVSSQSTAAAAIIASDADVAGIGGFSGRESAVTPAWLASEVSAGKLRWVLADESGGGGLRNDGRTGSTTAMAAVQSACKSVDADGVTLYDCAGASSALAGAG